MSDFDMAVAITLGFEGGFVHDLADPGGATNYGISQRAHPEIDIASLTRDKAIAIYKEDYWDRGGCEALPWPMNAIHFDTCVLFGLRRAAVFRDLAANAHDYLLRRMFAHMERARVERSQEKFLRGWLSRCEQLYANLLA